MLKLRNSALLEPNFRYWRTEIDSSVIDALGCFCSDPETITGCAV